MIAKTLATCIYKQILYSKSTLGFRIFSKIRQILLKCCDPIIRLNFRGSELRFPFSHTLFINQRLYPNYDMQLHKIASYIRSKTGNLCMIDVGANIGDTAILTNMPQAQFLLIEGEKKYASLLQENIQSYYGANSIKNLQEISPKSSISGQLGGGILIENCFITDKKGDYQINLSCGSAKLEKLQDSPNCDFINTNKADSTNSSKLTESSDFKADSAQKLHFKTLDSVVLEHNFAPNFIKIDTDGFDFKVLRSAENTLQTYKPLVFFEWDLFLLQAQNENPLSIFSNLANLGYQNALIFDNFGTLLCAYNLKDSINLKLLLAYTKNSDKNIYYYDVLVFPDTGIYDAKECMEFCNFGTF